MEGFIASIPGRLLIGLIVGFIGGMLSFALGQMLPRRWFDPEAFPYRAHPWEKNGAVYEKLGVRLWKDHVPDMSRIIPKMVKKKAALAQTSHDMERLARETCVAETVHWALIVVMSPIVGISIGGILGRVIGVLYGLGNTLFIIIQRYNRPRLVRVLKRMERKPGHA